MRMTSWWESAEWREYERECGETPLARQTLLKSADWQTRLIDLRPEESQLWTGVRRSYHALIHQAERDYSILQGHAGEIITHIAMPVHREAAGRQTRSVHSWEMMGEWVNAGKAAWWYVIDREQTRVLGYAFFARQDVWAYYFSAATLAPDVNHALIWYAMCGLKALGVKTLELGWQGEASDPKGKNIEFFRRGFGGYDLDVRRTVEDVEILA